MREGPGKRTRIVAISVCFSLLLFAACIISFLNLSALELASIMSTRMCSQQGWEC